MMEMKMKMHLFILITCLVCAAFSSPQFLTFKDGQVGVNFLGYHAEAGLGGGQNQNGVLGGLHASAGTPWGQNAAAGLGGNVNGRANGLLYAGAQATPDVGASTVLAGDTSSGGFGGSEAHANGRVAGSTRSVVLNGNTQNAQQPNAWTNDDSNAIQKIRPPKKYQTQFTPPTISRNVEYTDRQRNQGQSLNESSYVTKQRNKYRYRQRHPKLKQQRRRAYQNGVKNSETVRSKNVYRTVVATQKTWPLAVYPQQQQKAHTERRQLIADTPPMANANANAQVSANTDFNTNLNTNANANANANADTNVKTVVRSRKVVQTQPSAGVNSNLGISYNAQANGDVVRSALQIPIGILQSLQQSLSGLSASKTVTVSKHISK